MLNYLYGLNIPDYVSEFNYPSTGDVWLYGIIEVVIIGVVLFFAWKFVLPLIKKILSEYIQAQPLVNLLINLVSIIILVSAVGMVVSALSIGKTGSYLSLLYPGISMAGAILEEIKWLAFVGILLFLGFGFMRMEGAKPKKKEESSPPPPPPPDNPS